MADAAPRQPRAPGAAGAAGPAGAGVDRLGILIAAIMVAGAALPFATFRANRILMGQPRGLWVSLPTGWALGMLAAIGAVVAVALLRGGAGLRLAAALGIIAALLLAAGQAGSALTPDGDMLARVSPAAGFWLLLAGGSLLATDALARLRLAPHWRIAAVGAAAAGLAALLATGQWDDLSVLKEYGVRADAFWREARRHVLLAFGSLAAAAVVGVPLGVLSQRRPRMRAAVLTGLNIVQTIPSIAVFGLLIAPLAWIAAHVPGASAIGIAGIGAAPALVALFAYSLLPVVSNTIIGLDNVSPQLRDAALGMGMTPRQTLWQVEAPLAFPVILTGIRIVLVQNIGLATIAGLIGGGGFGVFVFQGMGQTATDLILLGALPTVLLALAAAIVLDAAVEMAEGRRKAGR